MKNFLFDICIKITVYNDCICVSSNMYSNDHVMPIHMLGV